MKKQNLLDAMYIIFCLPLDFSWEDIVYQMTAYMRHHGLVAIHRDPDMEYAIGARNAHTQFMDRLNSGDIQSPVAFARVCDQYLDFENAI